MLAIICDVCDKRSAVGEKTFSLKVTFPIIMDGEDEVQYIEHDVCSWMCVGEMAAYFTSTAEDAEAEEDEEEEVKPTRRLRPVRNETIDEGIAFNSDEPVQTLADFIATRDDATVKIKR